MGRTTLYPMVQFKKDTWEINEFEVASMFLLVGSEKSMLIDTGIGIGDLKAAVRAITDKPLIVVLTHNHGDHAGNARQFDEIWLNPKDAGLMPIPESVEKRRSDAALIKLRQYDSVGSGMFTAFPIAGFDLETDIVEPDEPMPVIHDLTDGMEFDLGGGRIIKAYECPGHTPGQMMFLDEYTRSLFVGDALNYNLGLGSVPASESLKYLMKMQELSDRYDGIYNGHHDFRGLGAPLGKDCLPNATDLCRQLVDGRYRPCLVPSFWGPASGRPPRVMIIKERNFIGFRGLELDKVVKM